MLLVLIHDGIVHAESTEADKALGVFDIRDVSDIPGIALGWIAKPDGSYEAPPVIEAPVVIPQSVSRAQAKILLHRAGLLDQVVALVAAADPEVQIWFAEAPTWQRANPHVIDIAAKLTPPLSPAQTDGFFLSASKIAD